MIFLDQDGFAEVLAVVLAAAHADRIFFEGAQAGRRLSRIQNLRSGAFDGAHKSARQRGDAAEALQQIQSHALAGQQGARGGAYACGNLSRRKFLAVVEDDFRFGVEVQKTEDLGEQFNPGKDQRRFGDHLAARALRGGDRRFRGDVAAPRSSARKDRSKLWYADASSKGDIGEGAAG